MLNFTFSLTKNYLLVESAGEETQNRSIEEVYCKKKMAGMYHEISNDYCC